MYTYLIFIALNNVILVSVMLDEYCTVLGTGGADGNVIIWASDGNLGNSLYVHH